MLLTVCLVSLFSISSGFTYTQLPTNICTGSLVEGQTTATTGECFDPYRPSGVANYIYQKPEVTIPAKLEDVRVTCFLDNQRNPALNISVRATSPDSSQEYEIEVLPETHVTSVYCGKILTEKPDRAPSKQNVGMEMRCNGKILKARMDVFIMVKIKGQMMPKTIPYRLPNCNHALMYDSNECEKERNDKIVFRLRQKNNSTVVILEKKTAYRTVGSKLYVTIKQRKDGFLDGWKAIREEPKVLYWPEQVTIFDDLTPGDTYQVTVWRPNEIVRYSKIITMKRCRSAPKVVRNLMKYKKRARLEKERKTLKH